MNQTRLGSTPTVVKPSATDINSWALLATCALSDCHGVLNAIDAESSEERECLVELCKRVESLFVQSLRLHGLMTRK